MAEKNYLQFVPFRAYVADSTLRGQFSRMDLATKLLSISATMIEIAPGGHVGASQLSIQPMTGKCESLGFTIEPVAPFKFLSGAVTNYSGHLGL